MELLLKEGLVVPLDPTAAAAAAPAPAPARAPDLATPPPTAPTSPTPPPPLVPTLAPTPTQVPMMVGWGANAQGDGKGEGELRETAEEAARTVDDELFFDDAGQVYNGRVSTDVRTQLHADPRLIRHYLTAIEHRCAIATTHSTHSLAVRSFSVMRFFSCP